MKRALALALLLLAILTAHAWTLLLLDSPAVMAFVLSDRFWPAVFGLCLAFATFSAVVCSALVFHREPVSESELSGRRPEGGA